MAGVRGFADPNVHYNGKHPVWDQVTNPTLTKDSDFFHPWYLNYLGGNWTEATQCMNAGSNGWTENQLAFNGGANDHWAVNNTPWSIGFYKREDLPVHFALAEEWIVGDMYQEGVIASTNPNRVTWVSGSINVPGGPQKPDEGGNPYIDNNETPGCESGGINCYPLKWKTTAEMYEQAGVSWQVYQDADNFDDNPLAWFEQFQNAPVGSPLHSKGMQGLSLDTFYAQAANGTLPEISIIVGPAELSEHPPHSPNDGAWLQRKVAEAVITSPKYSKTALFISYDETGGWADHVIPFHSPVDTPGEWLTDPTTGIGHTFQGPGFRLPFWIISPFTRHGGVYTEHCDHNSQIMFIEQWQAAKGRNVTTDEMVPWRRQNSKWPHHLSVPIPPPLTTLSGVTRQRLRLRQPRLHHPQPPRRKTAPRQRRWQLRRRGILRVPVPQPPPTGTLHRTRRDQGRGEPSGDGLQDRPRHADRGPLPRPRDGRPRSDQPVHLR
jgi:phospholipase C